MNETVEVAARLLRKDNIGALVVKDVCRTEGNTVVGMFSERDVVRALADHGPAALKMRVSALMSRGVVSCSSRDSLDRALELMDRHHVRHLPVLDEHTLVGVVSIRDVIALQGASAASHREMAIAA
jgi:CBS domain-containing protein